MTGRLLTHRRDPYGGPDAPVFASAAGTPLNPNNLQNRTLDPAAIATGFGVEVEGANSKKRLRSSIGFHAFRHTCDGRRGRWGRVLRRIGDRTAVIA